ncbi:peptidase S8/S53 domain-containing protein [Pyronema domesticum]|uniref:Similar to Alkaline protease 2 acc. no. P87184 n=1 Tax=Pyronema omphalodes (strain CBS 100304) TaxID=1076935 RepID=U4L6X8_PYROM|nr:peptidase S8/S53 domain-containing protein [Pyronema domesticum]CCX08368.1 Similar to Alkaline protease 2; acc. no. P87184 [Pyronema omphalodes CBS 100304]
MKLAILQTLLLLTPFALAAPRPSLNDDSFSTLATNTSNGTKPHVVGEAWTVIVDDEDPRSLDQLMTEMAVKPGDITHVYDNDAFKGFSGVMTPEHIQKMSVMKGVKICEPVQQMSVLETVQTNAPWGLQRISQESSIRNAPFDLASLAAFDFNYRFNGALPTNTTGKQGLGQGVDIYVIDTGVFTNHIDFDGRATHLETGIRGVGFDTLQDTAGHGTHCAGTAASTTFGVAKNANIISVKVLGSDSGSTSNILQGIDAMVKNHKARSKKAGFAGSVASMSLGGGGQSNSLDNAIAGATRSGIHFVVAAGNDNKDACVAGSPATATKISSVISVGAIDINDQRPIFSNFGGCTSLFAPGDQITSTWTGDNANDNNKINTIRGTSMACPHVSGLVAYMLSMNPSLATNPIAMKQLIMDTAVPISIDKGTVLLANNGFKG